MLLHKRRKILLKEWNIVRVAHSTRVPVLRNSLCPRCIHQVAVTCSCHCIEGLECILVEETLRIGSGLVGEHTKDESMGSRGDEEAEEAAEIVGILGDRLVICEESSYK